VSSVSSHERRDDDVTTGCASKPTAIAIAVVEHEGRYLIGQRGPDVPLAGMWEFPGGKVHDGETPEQASVRECREETDLEIVVRSPLGRVTHEYEHGTVELFFFDCAPVDSAQAPREPFRWVVRAELSRHAFPEANQRIVERLARGEVGQTGAARQQGTAEKPGPAGPGYPSGPGFADK
jgi:mutator protein MutT